MTPVNEMHWGDRVARGISEFGELVVGIDPILERLPQYFKLASAGWIDPYVSALLEAGSGAVAFVKFQSACFEALGSGGIVSLARAIRLARSAGYGIILDSKRGDIGSTASAYAKAYLTPKREGGSDLEVDCMTVNPFLGPDSLEPFIGCARKYGKGVLVLTKNSNPGATWLQDQRIDGELVSDKVGRLVHQWSRETLGDSGLGAVGAVVGATFPRDGGRLRGLMPDSVFLAPGMGSQGAKSEDVESMRRRGSPSGVLVPISRAISDFADKVIPLKTYTSLLHDRICGFQDALNASRSGVGRV